MPRRPDPLPRLLLLYGAMFAGFGAASPFLPSLLQERGLGPSGIGAVLAAGTGIRLLAGPAGCRADRPGRWRRVLVLVLLMAAAAAVAPGYLLPGGAAVLMAVSVLHAAVLAPLADAISSGAAPGRYGWVRDAGSAAFIVEAVAAGQAVAWVGLPSILWLNGGLLALAALGRAGCAGPGRGARACCAAGRHGGMAAWRTCCACPASCG